MARDMGVLTSNIGRGSCVHCALGAWVLEALQGAAARCVAVCAFELVRWLLL